MKHSNMRSKKLRFLTTAIAVACWTTVAMGGCSSSEEKRRASQLAGGCSINSDCDPDFICAFERCHVPCTEDRDCGVGELRCVKSETTGIFVCQLEDERHCKDEKDCPGEQICGIDEECRDACEENDDCIADQICAVSNECASTVKSKDHVDAQGNIIPDPDPSPSGGTSGVGGDGGGGASQSSAAQGGAPTEAGEGEGEGGGNGGPSPHAGAPAAGGPGYPPAEFEETDDGVETVNNDDRDHPVAITQSARFFLDKDSQDQDWFAYHAPDDGRAHILTLRLEQEAQVSTLVTLLTSEDDSVIGDAMALPNGTTRSIYATVGPNTTTHFKFAAWSTGSKGFVYLTLTDQVEQDEHEPNNSWQTSKSIALGQSVSGQLLAPAQADDVDLSQDWFAIELAKGIATFTFASLPSEGRAQVAYISPTSVSPTVLWTPPVGGIDASDTLNVTTAGTHYFTVRPYTESLVVAASFNAKPSYYDEQYTFSITQ
jgi:hypothetical protein